MVHEFALNGNFTDRHPAVLPARLRPPVFGCALIARAQLHRALASDDGAALTVVAGPAGAGKTAALTEWAHAVRACGAKVAWLTLLVEDNDLSTLTADLCAALRLEAEADAADSPVPAVTTARDAADAVMAIANRCADPVVLVLDDTQQLRDPEALEALELLVRFPAGRLRLVLAGRYEPPIGLGRLRLNGMVSAVAPEGLAFTAGEAEELLAQHDLVLSEHDLRALMTRTGGWAAGLRMAAIALARSADVSARIGEFTGDTRTVADYLADEILAGLPDSIRMFMVATAQEDYFTVDYAAAVSASADAGRTLDDLAKRNCMVVRHEGPEPRFSYHPLLRSYLCAELTRQTDRVQAEIHMRATEWFVGIGEPLRALEHAVLSEFVAADLSEMFVTLGIHAVMDGDAAVLLTLLDTASAAVAGLPGALLARAAAELDRGDPIAADLSLSRCSTEDCSEVVRIAAEGIRLHQFLWGGDGIADACLLERDHSVPDGHEMVCAYALLNSGWLRLVRGECRWAYSNIERSVALSKSVGCHRAVMAGLSALAMVAIAGDTISAMNDRSRCALEYARTHGLQNDSTSVAAHLVAAWVAHQRCDTDAAIDHMAVAEGSTDLGTHPALQRLTEALRAVVSLDRAGRPYAAAVDLHEAMRAIDWSRVPDRAIACALLIQLQIALRVGEIAWARESLADAERLVPDTMETELIRLVLHLQRGRSDTAHESLRHLLRGAVPAMTMRAPVDCLVLSSAIAETNRDHAAAHRNMARALELAAPEHLIRPFRDGGPVVATVLAAGMGRFAHHEEFAEQVLAKLDGPDTPRTVLLTTRELELLAELPSMRTTEEIAESLYVSVNTVKTHLRSIYRKMEVRSRREAVDAARTIGLL